jgi:hypothetical protein
MDNILAAEIKLVSHCRIVNRNDHLLKQRIFSFDALKVSQFQVTFTIKDTCTETYKVHLPK